MKLTKKGENTFEEIIQASIRCIATKGLEHTSIGEIAKMADVNRSLVAYYFPKKDELFLKITEHILDRIIQFMESLQERPQNMNSVVRDLETYFLNNHDHLINYLNLLYYCNLRYRYYGHLRDFYSYLYGFVDISEEEFFTSMDAFTGRLSRGSMQITHKLPMMKEKKSA
jgi:AcrR family transcriptional regulator